MVKVTFQAYNPRRHGKLDRMGGHSGEIVASYADLRKILGVPRTFKRGEGDGKVSTSWLVAGTDGSRWEVYDYKATNRYSERYPGLRTFRSLPTYRWCIGFRSRAGHVGNFIEWLEAKLAELHPPVVEPAQPCRLTSTTVEDYPSSSDIFFFS